MFHVVYKDAPLDTTISITEMTLSRKAAIELSEEVMKTEVDSTVLYIKYRIVTDSAQ